MKTESSAIRHLSPVAERKTVYFIFFLLYSLGLYFFYLKYVPLMTGFQIILIPFLLLVFIITLFSLDAGTLFFVSTFPLINSLPYFFGIDNSIPHAPVALILFLFFFFGFLLNGAFFGNRISFSHKIFKPLLLLSILCVLSAVITFFRYADFFPFLSDSIYEFSTNTKGVSSGGAIMSVFFTSLNYLSGIAFFIILVNVLKSYSFKKKLLFLFLCSSTMALIIGLYQLLFNRGFGNNLVSIQHGLINGTFKDALSFSVFIVMVIPLFLSLNFGEKGFFRIFAGISFPIALLLIFFTGSKIGLVCVFFSLFLFCIFLMRLRKKSESSKLFSKIHVITGALLLMVLVAVSAVVFLTSQGNLNSSSTVSRIKYMTKQGTFGLMNRWRGPLWQGAVSMMKDYPVSGVGTGAYIIEVANYEPEFHKYETPQSAENYFLQAGSELGFFGLALIISIFLLIGIEIKKSLTSSSREGENKFLYLGAGIGIIAYFLTLFFHTYIGSYEVKYTFWLLVALVFSRQSGIITYSGRHYKKGLFRIGFFCFISAF